jgi:adenylate cyclase
VTDTIPETEPAPGERASEVRAKAAPLIDWLLETRLRRLRPTLLFDEFCRRLRSLGVPLDRATLHLPQLHPQLRSVTMLWDVQSGGAVETGRAHGIEESDYFRLSPVRLVFDGEPAVRRRLEAPDCPVDFPVLSDLRAAGYRDYLMHPLLFLRGRMNAIGIASRRPGGFEDFHLALFEAVLPAFAAVLELRHLQRTARSLLDTYVGANTGERILSGAIKRGDGQVISAALWYCDLRGFTELSERLPLDQVIQLLNDYFDHVAKPVERHRGEILKFIGDALLAIFPIATGDQSPCPACQSALAAAQDALEGLADMNRARREAAQVPPHFGIALHRGQVMYGNVGASDRLDFTVIGPAVNLVTRMEALARPLDPPLVLSPAFAAVCGRDYRSLGHHALKGIAQEQEVMTLVDDR